ncbi:MAG: lipid A 3-O-deacylase [Parvicella sp.]|jgi:lipid A 3-O-deacylase
MRKIITAFLICIGLVSIGQKIDQTASFRNIENDNFFRISYDNDYFSETDKDYTQGYSLELSAPYLIKNPLNRILVQLSNGISKYGLLVEHIGFTPQNIGSEQIQYNDRPFAAAIMLKSYVISTDTVKKLRLSSSFNLGIIGPGAFGNEMQTGIHRAIDGVIPKGWTHQVRNDLVLNYGIDIEKQLVQLKDVFSIQADFKGKLGTLYSNTALGLNMTLGKINTPFSSIVKKTKFEMYGYAQALVNVIAYDATLQGGLFNQTSIYTIPNSQLERITYQLNYGVVIKIKNVYLEYSRAEMTKEHKNGKTIGWGGVKIGFRV